MLTSSSISNLLYRFIHRVVSTVYRVPVVRIVSPLPLTRKGVLPLPIGSEGGDTVACVGRGCGGPNSDEGTDALIH